MFGLCLSKVSNDIWTKFLITIASGEPDGNSRYFMKASSLSTSQQIFPVLTSLALILFPFYIKKLAFVKPVFVFGCIADFYGFTARATQPSWSITRLMSLTFAPKKLMNFRILLFFMTVNNGLDSLSKSA
jgi:hypothetical protein